MDVKTFEKDIEIAVNALKKAGYDPYEQLYGYVSTGELHYITRRENARALVSEMDINALREYLIHMK